MNENFIFTRKRFGLDNKVWLVMLLVCIGCIGLLSYKMIGEQPCRPVSLLVRNNVGSNKDFHPNDPLRFTAFMEGSAEVTWDFGDKTKTASNGPSVSHEYANPGDYVVTATVNGKCDEAIAIKIIRNKPDVTENLPAYVGNVILPSDRYPRVGDKVSFTSSIDAKSYEWTIDGSTQPAKKDKMATFVFDQAQSYTINLKLDNDPSKTYTTTIMTSAKPVTPPTAGGGAPPRILVPDNYPPVYTPPPVVDNTPKYEAPKPAESKPPVKPDPAPVNDGPVQPPRVYYHISAAQFKDRLKEVISKDKNVRDFEKYLCDGPATKVIENGTPSTFENLCANLAGSNYELLDVIYLDVVPFADKSSCVKTLKVMYKKPKKGWFHK